jgi:hypothetical protein
MPSLIHQTLSVERPWILQEAKGTPLSVRMALGRPKSRKVRSKTGKALRVLTFGRLRQVSRKRECRSAMVRGKQHAPFPVWN